MGGFSRSDSGHRASDGLMRIQFGRGIGGVSRLTCIPVFVALLAMLALGENLIPSQWAAIFSIVAGDLIIFIKRDSELGTSSSFRALHILISASLPTTLSHISANVVFDTRLTSE